MKNINHIMQGINPSNIISIDSIPQGLTNDNFKVTTQSGKDYVFRIPKPINQDIFNYEQEAQILNLLSKAPFMVDTLYFNPKTGIKVSPFIKNATTYSVSDYPQATQLIKSLHDLKIKSGYKFDIMNLYSSFKAYSQIYTLDNYASLIHEANSLIESYDTFLCHNDLVAGNFLFTKDKSYLIDFEYACDNHPYFDLMSYITENDIMDPNIRSKIYNIYFDHPLSSKDLNTLKIFEGAHHVIWCHWGQMMYEETKEAIYKDIASLKFNRLNQLYPNYNPDL